MELSFYGLGGKTCVYRPILLAWEANRKFIEPFGAFCDQT